MMSHKDIHIYTGQLIDITWDGRLCIHIAECGKSKGELFVSGRQPWCQPNLASTDDVKEIIRRCPSGALSFRDKQDPRGDEAAAGENTVHVVYNGPYYVRGELHLDGSEANMPAAKFRVALCRCGQSKRKPFCDNSHSQAGFEDFGAVGDKGPGCERGGPLQIKRVADGPLSFSGNFTIYSAGGRAAWHGTGVALCRCGESKNKPFCDGSHTLAGFKAE